MIILFTHFLGMVLRKRESEPKEPEPTKPELSDEVIAEAQRLEKIGFMKNRIKNKKKR